MDKIGGFFMQFPGTYGYPAYPIQPILVPTILEAFRVWKEYDKKPVNDLNILQIAIDCYQKNRSGNFCIYLDNHENPLQVFEYTIDFSGKLTHTGIYEYTQNSWNGHMFLVQKQILTKVICENLNQTLDALAFFTSRAPSPFQVTPTPKKSSRKKRKAALCLDYSVKPEKVKKKVPNFPFHSQVDSRDISTFVQTLKNQEGRYFLFLEKHANRNEVSCFIIENNEYKVVGNYRLSVNRIVGVYYIEEKGKKPVGINKWLTNFQATHNAVPFTKLSKRHKYLFSHFSGNGGDGGIADFLDKMQLGIGEEDLRKSEVKIKEQTPPSSPKFEDLLRIKKYPVLNVRRDNEPKNLPLGQHFYFRSCSEGKDKFTLVLCNNSFVFERTVLEIVSIHDTVVMVRLNNSKKEGEAYILNLDELINRLKDEGRTPLFWF